MNFRVLSKVHGVRIGEVRHPPGSIVDLPETYLGENYLEPIPDPVTESAPEPEPVKVEAPRRAKKSKKEDE